MFPAFRLTGTVCGGKGLVKQISDSSWIKTNPNLSIMSLQAIATAVHCINLATVVRMAPVVPVNVHVLP